MTTFNGLRRNHRGQAESSQLDDQASRWKEHDGATFSCDEAAESTIEA